MKGRVHDCSQEMQGGTEFVPACEPEREEAEREDTRAENRKAEGLGASLFGQ